MKVKLNDEQFEALKQYKELISHCRSVVKSDVAKQIWTLWEKVRNCKSRFTLCSACIASKVKGLNRLIDELKDDPRWNGETVETTVETTVEETVETTVEETVEETEEKPKRNRKKKDNE